MLRHCLRSNCFHAFSPLTSDTGIGAHQSGLSARLIRQTLETEFTCDLRARKNAIARAIQATLEDEARGECDDDAVRDVDDEEVSGATGTASGKRRKLSRGRPHMADGIALGKLGIHSVFKEAQLSLKSIAVSIQFACDECNF